jgi:hypothetical protein
MSSKSKQVHSEKDPEMARGEKLLRAAFNKFMRFDLLGSEYENHRLVAGARDSLEKAENIFDSKMQKLSSDSPLYDVAVFNKNRVLAVDGFINEFYKENLR